MDTAKEVIGQATVRRGRQLTLCTPEKPQCVDSTDRASDSSLIHHRVHATHEGMATTHDSFRDQRRCNAW